MINRISPNNRPIFPTFDQLAALPPDGGPEFNRLIFTKSPYLLQHAANPIDWYPWGEEAFSRASRKDCPVLLSIGYSTCHWCHVMAHESFESGEIADLVNQHFVAIKVDREERPDVDTTYMAACQLLTGSGGWPLTLLLTPDRRPFYAATYMPPTSRNGMIGLAELLQKVIEMWWDNRKALLQGAARITDALQKIEGKQVGRGSVATDSLLAAALDRYRADFDRTFAGFGAPPKFPAPHNLELLLRLERRFKAGDAGQMVDKTLTAVRTGGIYDQLGFGMHRYAVDRQWLVPHFEKMLYDQALLILAACRASTKNKTELARRMASETADYLLRDLRHPGGAFYCGEDADSEGAEGTFYLWDIDQVRAALPGPLAEKAVHLFRLTDSGNFEGRNILTLDPAALDDPELETIRTALLTVRNRRQRPHRDEKILTGWNGLTIAALARAGTTCHRPELTKAAEEAANFILANLQRSDGRLLRRFCDGEAAIPAFLEDYACLGFGLLELYQADFDCRWLLEARRLARDMLDLFKDGNGGLYDTGRDVDPVLVRGRSLQDGALPSGISVAAGLLLQLGQLIGEPDTSEAADRLLELHLGQIERYPCAFSWLLSVLDSRLDPEPALVLVPNCSKDRDTWLKDLRRHAPADLTILVADAELQRLNLPALNGRTALAGQTTAWYCDRSSCRPPATCLEQVDAWFDNQA